MASHRLVAVEVGLGEVTAESEADFEVPEVIGVDSVENEASGAVTGAATGVVIEVVKGVVKEVVKGAATGVVIEVVTEVVKEAVKEAVKEVATEVATEVTGEGGDGDRMAIADEAEAVGEVSMTAAVVLVLSQRKKASIAIKKCLPTGSMTRNRYSHLAPFGTPLLLDRITCWSIY